MSIATTLFQIQARRWLTRRGFLGVVAVAALPLLLTGTWLLTHQGDVVAESVTWDSDDPTAGDEMSFTATIRNEGRNTVSEFNATLAIGELQGNSLFPLADSQTTIERLGPGDTATVTLEWTAEGGVKWLLLQVDDEDVIGEIDEFNNQFVQAITVQYAAPDPDDAPTRPGIGGEPTANTTHDLRVDGLIWEPAVPQAGETTTVRATVHNDGTDPVQNASVTLQAGGVQNNRFTGLPQFQDTIDLDAGESRTINATWTAREGVQWLSATVAPPDGSRDAEAADNMVIDHVLVQPLPPDEENPIDPPERLTIKQFYTDVLTTLQLRVVVPLIALFYAAGVVADARKGGELVYMLTRPIPRWGIPLTRFATSFLVGAVAITIGTILSFIALFQTPQGDIGFLSTPLLGSLLALFAYTAAFTLLGVMVRRPYLWGLVFVIGWETFAGFLVPWVRNLTLQKPLLDALQAWPIDEGWRWLPDGAGVDAVWKLVIIGFGLLLASGVVMTRREFQDA